MSEHKGSKIKTAKYHWGLTRDVGGLTITGPTRSMIRRGGLVYSQFYAMIKLQYDSTKRFPWDDMDDTLAIMAVDPIYREAIRSVVRAKPMNTKACRASHNHCGR